MKRYYDGKLEDQTKPKLDAFVADIVKVYRKHGLSIGHEDSHGSFTIESLSDGMIEWLEFADDRTAEEPSH